MSKLLVEWPSCETDSTATPSTSLKRPLVRFAPEQDRTHYLPGEDLPRQWYSGAERKQFKVETLKDIQLFRRAMLQEAPPADPAEHCVQGIEHLVCPATAKKVTDSKAELMAAVLAEQARQRAQGQPDCQQLACLSSLSSAWARDRARLLGRQYAKAAAKPSARFDLSHNQTHRYAAAQPDPSLLWYSEAERKHFKMDTVKNVKLFRGILLKQVPLHHADENQFCIHGIEHLVCPSTTKRIIECKSKLLASVLDEQRDQESRGHLDQDQIAYLSLLNSRWSRKRARHIGIEYEKTSLS